MDSALKPIPCLLRKSVSNSVNRKPNTIRRRLWPPGACKEGRTASFVFFFDPPLKLTHSPSRSQKSSNSESEHLYGSSSSSSLISSDTIFANWRWCNRPAVIDRNKYQMLSKASGPKFSRIWKSILCAFVQINRSSFFEHRLCTTLGLNSRSIKDRITDLYMQSTVSLLAVTNKMIYTPYIDGFLFAAIVLSIISNAASTLGIISDHCTAFCIHAKYQLTVSSINVVCNHILDIILKRTSRSRFHVGEVTREIIVKILINLYVFRPVTEGFCCFTFLR